MKKDDRLKRVRSRKNFILTLILIVLLWFCVFGTVLFLDPEVFINIMFFLLILFLALLTTLATIFENTRRGFLLSASVVAFLLLRYLHVGNLVNGLLIAGISIALEIYISKK